MASEAAAKKVTEKPEPAAGAPAEADAPLFDPLRDLDKRARVLIGVLVLVANVPLIHYFFRHVLAPMPTKDLALPFADDFNREEIGDNYFTIGGDWRIENGELHSPGVKNNPLWLKLALPDDVAVDFDVRGTSPEGDIRFEMFGDGLNPYSGYVFLFGGFNNQLTAIGRLSTRGAAFGPDGIGLQAPPNNEEQAAVAGRSLAELFQNGTLKKDAELRVERHDVKVVPNQRYHMHVERKGGRLTWMINGQQVLELNDPMPLAGKGHDRFGPSGAEGPGGVGTDAFFDNLSIQKL